MFFGTSAFTIFVNDHISVCCAHTSSSLVQFITYEKQIQMPVVNITHKYGEHNMKLQLIIMTSIPFSNGQGTQFSSSSIP